MITRILSLLSIAVLLAIPAVVGAGVGGRIALYSDANLSQCALVDTSPNIADIYVVQRVQGSPASVLGVVGVRFALVPSPDFAGTWLEDIVSVGLGAIGTSPSGIAVISQSCWFTDKLLLHVRYQMQGSSPPCSFLSAVPYPGYGSIQALICSTSEPIAVDGGTIRINPNSSCPCEIPLAAESTTWGRIKAMYGR